MKQNVIMSVISTITDAIIAVLLYMVFPIIPLYIFIMLLALVIASSALRRYGITAAILITYVVLTFITTLGHASLLIMPLLIAAYLITEAGIINDVAIASWALLFTPLYWLSIPLSIAPSVKGYSVRSAGLFVLLTLLYVIGAAYQGITWIPITAIHATNLDLIHGMESLLFDNSGNLLTMYHELSNAPLYFILIIITVVPPLISRYLTRLLMTWHTNAILSQAIINLTPQLITASILYIPLIINTWNYYVTPLVIVGAVIIGLATYALEIAQSRLKAGIQSMLSARKSPPIVIPVVDPITITEYSYWAKKLPKDDVDFANTIINTLSKTGVIALYASLPQDRVEIIAKVLFGLTRSKGFIVKGDIDDLSNDINWFIRTHERSLLVLMPNEINKDLLLKLIDYNRHTKLYALIVNSDVNAINKLRKYGIEVVKYSTTESIGREQRQSKYVEEIRLKQVNEAKEVINTDKSSNNPVLTAEGFVTNRTSPGLKRVQRTCQYRLRRRLR